MISFFHNLDFFFDFNFNRTGLQRKIRSSNRLCQSWFLCQRVRSFTYWDSSFTPGNKKCCFVYKKEILISNVIPPVGVGESIEKAFLPVLLAQASSQMSMPCLSFPFWYAKASFYSIKCCNLSDKGNGWERKIPTLFLSQRNPFRKRKVGLALRKSDIMCRATLFPSS